MLCWIISVALTLELGLLVTCNRGGHGGGGGGRGGWGHNGNGHRNGWRPGGWGQGNYPYFNGGGHYGHGGWNPGQTQIFPQPVQDQFEVTPVLPEPVTCPRPSFADNIPELIIEKCETNPEEHQHRSCWDSSIGIPIGWTVLMTCKKNSIRLKQPSTCSSSGNWTTKFPPNCDPLFAKYDSISGLEAFQKIPLAVTHRPTPSPHVLSSTPANQDHLEEDDIVILPKLRAFEKPCPMLKMQLSDNFVFSCFLHHLSSTETSGCIRTHAQVPSGSVALLKCRPPFYNRDGHYSTWTCEDGSWSGDFDQKLKCFYSKVPPGIKLRPRPVTSGTTTRPRAVSTSKSTSPYGWIVTGSTTAAPKEQVRSTTATPRTTTSTTSRPPIKFTTATTPASTSSKTTNNGKPDSDPEEYDYNYDYKEDSTTTKKSTSISTPTSDKVLCPPLKSRSEGLVLECVSKTKASPNQGEQIFVNGCDIPQPVGAEAKYSCRQYYESTGGLVSIYRKCKDDRTWSGSSEGFTCIPQCGSKNQVFVPLITSGFPAFKGEWPWHAGLFQRDVSKTSQVWEYICGGTLISRKTIVTAAHCVTFQDSSTLRNSSIFRFDLGRFELDKVDDVIQTKEVESIHIHPSYSPFGYDSDIAIVILKEPVGIGYFVRPICFPQSLNTAQEELMLDEGSLGTVAGWGKTEVNKVSNILHTAELRVVSQKECSAGTRGASGGRLQIKSTTYCAAPNTKNGTETTFVNVCNGDSGGGMYFPQTTSDSAQTRWYIQGVVSVGIGNENNQCQPDRFSFFTRIGRYADWLIRVMSENDAL